VEKPLDETVRTIVEKILSESVNLPFKRLFSEARAPVKRFPTDSCYDVFASSITHESNYLEYGTGVAFDIPPGYELKVYPRSSISVTSLIFANSVGVIDESFKGELMVRFKAISPYTGKRYILGDRIAQVELVRKTNAKLVEVEEVVQSVRNKNGCAITVNS